MPTITLRANRAVVSEIYQSLQPIIRRIAYRFARRYRTDPDETLAEANYLFLRAYHSHNPEHSTLEQRLKSYIWNRLLNGVVADSKRQAKHPKAEVPDLPTHTEPEPFDADDAGSWVSRDARLVLGLVLETPPEITQRVRESFDPAPGVLKKQIRRYLRDVLGWDRDRIETAYYELRVLL